MAYKTNQAFKLSQTTKRMMANLPKGLRNDYKKIMIDGQMSEQVNKTRRKEKGTSTDESTD